MPKFLPIFIGIFLNFLPIFMASYCGESAIPFSFEVLPNGNPILGCARPNCFGWNAFGQPIRANDSNFYRVNKQPDGFFRKALTANMPKPFSEKDAAFYQPQNATCFAGFKRGRCSSSGGHWVGGIAPNWEGNDDNSLLLRCCHWKGLAQSIDRGMATVQNGQIVYGGEVLQGERQYAFDYISDIFRVNNGDKQKSFQYEVAIYRMACLPRPERLTANVEPSVLKEMVHKFALSAQNDLAKASHTVEKSTSLGGEKSTKQLHKGESRVIKTSKWTASPVDNEGEEEEEKNEKQLVDNIHLGDAKRNKAFAAPNSPIQGPFMENELNGQKGEINDYEEEEIDPNKNLEYSSQTQQSGGQYGQNDPSIHFGEQQNQFNNNNNNYNNYGTANIATESANANEPQMVMKKRIICDRNVTRSRSRAVRQACEATEVEVPEGSQAQISRGNSYYDPGQTQTQYQQSSWYYYYPSAGARQCFTGDTRVQIGGNGGKMRRMDELRVGDWVLSTNQSHIVYTIVESWIHRVPKQWANFVRIELEDGRVLKLTEKHFLYKRSNCGNEFEADGPIPIEKIHGEGQMVYAKEVKAGDCLFGHGKNSDFALIFEQKVAKVGIVREQGIYAPMTGTGDIFVEGILASCYSIESSPVLQKSIFNSWKSSPKIIENLFGHFDGDEINLPGWLHFMVEHLMPIVLPK